jgi:hypothetical protein
LEPMEFYLQPLVFLLPFLLALVCLKLIFLKELLVKLLAILS